MAVKSYKTNIKKEEHFEQRSFKNEIRERRDKGEWWSG
jgi:hypothetical protein